MMRVMSGSAFGDSSRTCRWPAFSHNLVCGLQPWDSSKPEVLDATTQLWCGLCMAGLGQMVSLV